MINIDKYIISFRSVLPADPILYTYKPNYKWGTRTIGIPFILILKAIFAYNKYSTQHPFKLLVTSILQNKYQDIDSDIYKMRDILLFTKGWYFQDEFVYPELPQSFLLLSGQSSVLYNSNLVLTKKFAKLLFKYHTKLYFRLHSLDPVFLTLTESKEEALIAAMTEPKLRGEQK
jgi:hypothetical protein